MQLLRVKHLPLDVTYVAVVLLCWITGNSAQDTRRHVRWIASHVINLIISTSNRVNGDPDYLVPKAPPFDFLSYYPNGSFLILGSSKLTIEWLAAKINIS